MEVFLRQHLLQSFVLYARLYVLDFNLRNSDSVVAAGCPTKLFPLTRGAARCKARKHWA